MMTSEDCKWIARAIIVALARKPPTDEIEKLSGIALGAVEKAFGYTVRVVGDYPRALRIDVRKD